MERQVLQHHLEALQKAFKGKSEKTKFCVILDCYCNSLSLKMLGCVAYWIVCWTKNILSWGGIKLIFLWPLLSVTSLSLMRERLEGVCRAAGLKFMPAPQHPNTYYISTDVFFVELQMEPSGRCSHAKITQAQTEPVVRCRFIKLMLFSSHLLVRLCCFVVALIRCYSLRRFIQLIVAA